MCVLLEWFKLCNTKNSLAVSVVYIVIFSLQQIDQQRDRLTNHCYFSPEDTQKSLI